MVDEEELDELEDKIREMHEDLDIKEWVYLYGSIPMHIFNI